VFPAVTSILEAVAKPALIPWAAKVERELVIEAAASLWEDAPRTTKMSREAFIASLGNRLGKTRAHQKALAKAGEIGTQLHSLIEWNLRRDLGQVVGPEPHIRDEALWAFMVWEDWRKSVDLKPLAIEQVVWSNLYEYAGTMDLLAECTLPEIGRVRALLDWKTGKAIYGEAGLQNAGYVQALVEMKQATPPVTGVIVRLPKVDTDPEPEFKVISWEEIQSLFQVFLTVKDLWHWMEGERLAYENKKAESVIPKGLATSFMPGPEAVIPRGIAKHQAALLDDIRTKRADLGMVELREGKHFIWLPVAVLKRMGQTTSKEPLPVALADLTEKETKAIWIALTAPELGVG
jgi:hypothetical protein